MLRVACAIIEDTHGRVLVAQRSSQMDLPYKWEFPGGKVENDESAEECVVREIQEELSLEVKINKALNPAMYSYPDKDILLLPYICSIVRGTIHLKEHIAFKWLNTEDLIGMEWANADIPVVHEYLYYRCNYQQ